MTIRKSGIAQELELNKDKDEEFKKEISLDLLALGESQAAPLSQTSKVKKTKKLQQKKV